MTKNDIQKRLLFVEQHLGTPLNIPTEKQYYEFRYKAIQYVQDVYDLFEREDVNINFNNTDPVI